MKLTKQNPAISRRTFLAGTAGTTLVMGFGSLLPGCSSDDAKNDLIAAGASNRFSPAIWFEVDGTGAVLVNITKAEMGQHVGTALARIVADELGTDWSRVSIKHVDTDPRWGAMVTGGSWSVTTSFEMLSKAGAAGRTVLIEAGAALLGVDAATCSAENGNVISGDEQVSFAEIVAIGDVSREISDEEMAALPIKAAGDRKLIGQQTRALDLPAKTDGTAVYGLDVELPNMVYAHPMIPPTRFGSKIVSIDDSAAKDIPGYQQTIQINDSTSMAEGWAMVIADSFPAAMKSAAAVQVNWAPGPTAAVTEAHMQEEAEKLVSDPANGVLVVDEGDVAAARESAASMHSAIYRTSTLLHFTLEPQNALVEFVDGVFHIHAGNQFQSWILPVLAAALEVEESNIVIHTYYIGGGFGRRLLGDQMVPAALAARELGRPVKLVFQRAEDSRFDCVRSPSVVRFDASFDAQGALTGIDHGVSSGWPTKSLLPPFMGTGVDGNGQFDPFSVNGADHWYTLANHRVRTMQNELVDRTTRTGYLRAVGPGWTGWGVESFMDEVAAMTGEDPVEFRLSRLDAAGKNAGEAPKAVGGAARLAATLRDVAERSGWGADLPEGEGMGVAVSFGQERAQPTWTACVAHVAVDSETGKVTVKKLWQSIDCGTVVHPDGALAQAEGAMLWGVSMALHEGTAFENGEVKDLNLDSYTPLRMADVPELDINFIESTEFPTGLGEPPLIAVPPAIGNAVFAATGTRVRDLPIKL
jgi:isoquinoline 1-oxidoreductase beta subunit